MSENLLFKDLVFHMRPCSAKIKLKKLITENGGRFCKAGEKNKNIINLKVDKDERSGIHTDFVEQSIARNELLPIEQFDLSKPATDSSKMKVDRNVFGKARQAYLEEEDEAIIQYVASHQTEYGTDGSTGGNLIWKQMEEKKITSHTWQSMKSRYHSHLEHRVPYRPNIITRSSGNSTVAYAVSRDSPMDLVKAPPSLKPRKKFDDNKKHTKKLYSSSTADPFDQSPINSIGGKSDESLKKVSKAGETSKTEIVDERKSQEVKEDTEATQSLSEGEESDNSIIYSPSSILQPVLTSTCGKEGGDESEEKENNVLYPFPDGDEDDDDDFDQQLVAAAYGSQQSQSSSIVKIGESQSSINKDEKSQSDNNYKNCGGQNRQSSSISRVGESQSDNNYKNSIKDKKKDSESIGDLTSSLNKKQMQPNVELEQSQECQPLANEQPADMDIENQGSGFSPVSKKAKKKEKKNKRKDSQPKELNEFDIPPCTCETQRDYSEVYELMNYFDNLPQDFNWKMVREKMEL